jgi:hypothetical protein
MSAGTSYTCYVDGRGRVGGSADLDRAIALINRKLLERNSPARARVAADPDGRLVFGMRRKGNGEIVIEYDGRRDEPGHVDAEPATFSS